MGERNCALGLGIVFTLLGIAGFIPSLLSLPSTAASYIPAEPSTDIYTSGFGYLFGIFPTNALHNLVHLVVGLFGLAASTSIGGARTYNRVFAVAYIAIVVMGLLPVTKTTFGLMPIFGNNVWLNAITGAIATYFGFLKPTTPGVGTPAS